MRPNDCQRYQKRPAPASRAGKRSRKTGQGRTLQRKRPAAAPTSTGVAAPTWSATWEPPFARSAKPDCRPPP
eukprot:2356120-Pyramimonas_sp.AAC.1